jgi:ACS family allantoate permease-like MFS transporter
MQRTHLGRTVGVFAICWGACVLSIAFCKDFTQLATVRFLQGAFECSIQPAFLLITSSFYPTRELPLRVIIWGTGSTSFGVISDLSLYGIGRAATKSGLIAPWRGWVNPFINIVLPLNYWRKIGSLSSSVASLSSSELSASSCSELPEKSPGFQRKKRE